MSSFNKKPTLAVIWPGYRKNNQYFFELISSDERFSISVLWIKYFKEDDMPPNQFLSMFNWHVVGAKDIRMSSYSLGTLFKMIRAVWREVSQADCVLTSTQAPLHSKVAFIFVKLLKKKIFIVTQQWTDYENRSFLFRLYKKIDTYMMRHCDTLFPHGTNQQLFALAQGVNKNKIKILPFLSGDLRELPSNYKEIINKYSLDGKRIVLYFGRITPRKGLMDLLEAFKIVETIYPDIVLMVCGGADKYFLNFSQANSYESECRHFAETLGLNKVIFVGQINPLEKQDYFAIADLFVHPHTKLSDLNEGWGLPLNEAASMALPIITTDRVGAAPDLVSEGINGFIIPAGDVQVLSKMISKLLSDASKLKQFSLASRQVFELYHQPKKIPEMIWEAINGR